MSLPKYEEYKESNTDWLGPVPAHWAVGRLKTKVSLVTEKATQRNRPVALENIESWSGRLIQSEGDFEADGVAFSAGDILFGKLRPYLAKVHLADCPGEAVGDCHVLRPASAMNARYLQYQMLNRAFIDVIDGSTFGSKMPRASWESLGNMTVAAPPSGEQAAIAAFLSRETTKIDVLIAEQKNLVALLVEKRLATISHAVTRGLNNNAPMKDSGVAWLSEVPAHWEVKKLRYLASVVRGASPRPAGDPRFFANDNEFGLNCPWVTVAEVTKDEDVYLNEVVEYLTPTGVEHSQSFETGTLIFTNSGATLGVPKILAIDCCANDGILAFRYLSDKVDIRFLYYFLLTTTERLRTEMKQGGGQPNLNTGIVKEISLALPPNNEQLEVVSFLEAEILKLDSLRTQAERAITLLKERRDALITAAVTGQIDVRGTVLQAAAESLEALAA